MPLLEYLSVAGSGMAEAELDHGRHLKQGQERYAEKNITS